EPYAATNGTYWFGEGGTGDPEKGDRPLLYQAGRRPWEQQALFLAPMQGSDCSPAQAATLVPSRLFAQFRKPHDGHPKRWSALRKAAWQLLSRSVVSRVCIEPSISSN